MGIVRLNKREFFMAEIDDSQEKTMEWHQQWSTFSNDGEFLFLDWIAPANLDTFRDKSVLECGCGGGYHTSLVAPLAKKITAVDLNTAEIAKERNKQFNNTEFVEADIAAMDLGSQFDVVFCVGVIHHTDDPSKTFSNIVKHTKPGGTVIVYAYSSEGNWPMRYIVEPFRRVFLRMMPRSVVYMVSVLLTALMYPFIHTIYRLPITRSLPYYEFFINFRRLSWRRNLLDVYDKLNAPQTHFINRETCDKWMLSGDFEPASISIKQYRDVCWSLVGVKKA